MLDHKQEVHLFVDKIRGLMKFVGHPRPPHPEFEEATRIFVEIIEKETKALVGQILTPAHLQATISIALRAIQHVLYVTGREIYFFSHVVEPGDFDDAEYMVTLPSGQGSRSLVELLQDNSVKTKNLLFEKVNDPEKFTLDLTSGTTAVYPPSDREELLKLLEGVADEVASCDISSDLRKRIEAKIGRKGKAW